MQFFVYLLRVVIDIMLTRVVMRALVAVMGLFGLASGYAYLVALAIFFVIIFHPKTRVVYNLVRELIVTAVCKVINLVVPVPENLHGARYAKAPF
jgi:hypothetical protein